MKKIVFISLILITGNLLLKGQEFKKFRFGLFGAPSMAWTKTNTKTDYFELKKDGSQIGFGYGIIAEFGLTKNYSFATGIDISYSGGKIKSIVKDTLGNIISNLSSSDKVKLQYLELPLTLKMKTNEIGYITYFGTFGIAPGVCISAKNSSNDDIKSDISSMKISMLIGLGAEYSLGGSTSVVCGLNFNNGFTNIFNTDFVNGNEKVKYKAISNYFALQLGVIF